MKYRIDIIDLFYLHRVDPRTPIEESVGAMANLVREANIEIERVQGLTPELASELTTLYEQTRSQSAFDYDELEEEEKTKISKLPTVLIRGTNGVLAEITANHAMTFESWCSQNVRVIPSDDF